MHCFSFMVVVVIVHALFLFGGDDGGCGGDRVGGGAGGGGGALLHLDDLPHTMGVLKHLDHFFVPRLLLLPVLQLLSFIYCYVWNDLVDILLFFMMHLYLLYVM